MNKMATAKGEENNMETMDGAQIVAKALKTQVLFRIYYRLKKSNFLGKSSVHPPSP